ncbi:hypothetical protein [Dactylosporangium salmoneum]|uniref:Uncharacterized protein n=1 Tax=Dactylosporangium salmoneum TaxID=53361 RepID=A0ABN3G5Z8_9ACTN
MYEMPRPDTAAMNRVGDGGQAVVGDADAGPGEGQHADGQPRRQRAHAEHQRDFEQGAQPEDQSGVADRRAQLVGDEQRHDLDAERQHLPRIRERLREQRSGRRGHRDRYREQHPVVAPADPPAWCRPWFPRPAHRATAGQPGKPACSADHAVPGESVFIVT